MDVSRAIGRSSTSGTNPTTRTRRLRLATPLAVAAMVTTMLTAVTAGAATAVPSAAAHGTRATLTAAAAPGVTATTVTVGQVDDLTLPIPGLFKGAEDGTEAYFDYINSIGGVNGRKIKLDAGDSLYSQGTVASVTQQQIKDDFALVGGFSLDDAAEEPLVKAAKMPDIAYPLDPDLSDLPTSYSPFPNADNDTPTTIFKVLRKKFPTQIKHVGIIWANATASTSLAERAFERAAKSQGFKIVYDASFVPSQTTFLANVLTMKSRGVQMFISQQLPDSYAETIAQEMAEQNFHPLDIQEDAYTSNLVKDGGSAVNGMYLTAGFELYLGTDNTPAVRLFTKWMHKADASANFELESLFGWASAELFVDGLKKAGSPPTRAGLEAALDKITSFNAGGLLATGNPARNIPGSCVILAQVKNGKIVRVPPSPKTGYICMPHSLIATKAFKPEVRPKPSN
ncbi:MAG: ABC transporter substrate-binding protein [Acidimicrobiales bacterium]